MAVLIELKRLKDLKIVGMSSINGNIKLDGTETPVYTHPSGTNPHGTTKSDVGLGNCDNTSDINKPISTLTQTALNLKVDKVVGKSLISDTEITRLSGITSSATKVETSTVNGNIKIDGVESNIYSQPLRKLNTSYYLYEGTPYAPTLPNWGYDIMVNKSNMDNIIYVCGAMFNYNIILSNEVRLIDDNFTYNLFCNFMQIKIVDENGVAIPELIDKFPNLNNTQYIITKIKGVYQVQQEGYGNLAKVASDNKYESLDYLPPLYGTGILDDKKYSNVQMRNCDVSYYCDNSMAIGYGTSCGYTDNQLVIGTWNISDTDNTTMPRAFIIGNGTGVESGDAIKSNAFEVYKDGKVGVFNDLLIKGGTALNTVSQTVQGAINELKGLIMPYATGTVSITVPANNGDFTYLIPHTLGVKPSRYEIYTLNDGQGYKTQFPLTKASSITVATGTFTVFSSLARAGVDANNIMVNFIRQTPYLETTETYQVQYYLYK